VTQLSVQGIIFPRYLPWKQGATFPVERRFCLLKKTDARGPFESDEGSSPARLSLFFNLGHHRDPCAFPGSPSTLDWNRRPASPSSWRRAGFLGHNLLQCSRKAVLFARAQQTDFLAPRHHPQTTPCSCCANAFFDGKHRIHDPSGSSIPSAFLLEDSPLKRLSILPKNKIARRLSPPPNINLIVVFSYFCPAGKALSLRARRVSKLATNSYGFPPPPSWNNLQQTANRSSVFQTRPKRIPLPPNSTSSLAHLAVI